MNFLLKLLSIEKIMYHIYSLQHIQPFRKVSNFIYWKKNYNQSFSDIVPLIYANSIKETICIFNKLSNGTIENVLIHPRDTPDGSLVLHRCRDHFNGAVSNCENNLAVSENNNTRIKYSSNDLHALQPKSLLIKRSVRKTLFKYGIWRPQGRNTSSVFNRTGINVIHA